MGSVGKIKKSKIPNSFFYRPFYSRVGRSAMLKINRPWPNSRAPLILLDKVREA